MLIEVMVIIAALFLITYWTTERILNRLNSIQDILLARLRLMESTLLSLGLDKVDKRIEECKQVEIHRYILPDEILNKRLEALPESKLYSGCLSKDAESLLGIKKKTGPKPRLRTAEEMETIIKSILADKKQRGNTSLALFKKYKITKATFYKYATEEQAKELMEMQTALRKKRNFGRGRK